MINEKESIKIFDQALIKSARLFREKNKSYGNSYYNFFNSQNEVDKKLSVFAYYFNLQRKYDRVKKLYLDLYESPQDNSIKKQIEEQLIDISVYSLMELGRIMNGQERSDTKPEEKAGKFSYKPEDLEAHQE